LATKEEKDTLTLVNDFFQSAIDSPVAIDFKNNAIKDFDFNEGRQWTDKEVKDLNKRGQPVVVENEIHPVVQDLMGTYESQPTLIKYRARNLGDDEVNNDILNQLLLHAQQESQYEFEEGDMAKDGFISGMGALEVTTEIDDSLQPKLIFKHEDVLNMFPDPRSKRYDWNIDARFVSRAKWVDWREAQEMWPNKKREIASLVHHDPVKDSTSEFKRDNFVDERTNKVRPVEMWYKVYNKRRIAVIGDASIDITDFNKKQMSAFKKENPDAQTLERIETQMKFAIFIGAGSKGGGGLLLDSGDSPYDHNLFPFVPYYVFRKKSGEPYSTVRLIIDPQTEVNKRRSKSLHLLNTNQTQAEDGAIRDKDKHKKEMAKPDGILEYKRGTVMTIEKNIEVAATQMTLQAESKDAIRRISGVTNNPAELPREVRSGIGLARAQNISDKKKLPQFNNLRRTRKMIGEIALHLIKQYYTSEKVFFVTDDLGAVQKYKLTQNDIKTLQQTDYDVIVEEAPDITTIQDEQAQMISGFLQTFGKIMPPSVALQMFLTVLQMSQIKGKNQIIENFQQEMQNIPPELPKTQLQLQWAELTPQEKIAFAQRMQLPELAQAISQNPEPSATTKKEIGETQRKQIDSRTEILTEGIKGVQRSKDKSQRNK
jgi:hypothetical protein